MRRLTGALFAALLLAPLVGRAEAVRAQDTQEDFNVTNTNRDAAIDRNEYRGRMVEVFYFADKNRDGVVTIEELTVSEPVPADVFRAADTNGDGRLDLQEFVAYRMRDFETADKNHDGVLILQEVQAWTAPASVPPPR